MKGTACAPRRTELHAQCMTDGVKDAGCYQVLFPGLGDGGSRRHPPLDHVDMGQMPPQSDKGQYLYSRAAASMDDAAARSPMALRPCAYSWAVRNAHVATP